MDQGQEILERVMEMDEGDARPNEIRLSSGVVLEVVGVSPWLLNDLQRRFKRPPVPTFTDEEGRKFENLDDPEYKAEIERIDNELEEMSLYLMIGKGTRLLSKPEHLPDPEDEGWIEDVLDVLPDFVRPDKPSMRYVYWVKYVATRTGADLQMLLRQVRNVMGVTEEAVAEAAERFPGTEER